MIFQLFQKKLFELAINGITVIKSRNNVKQNKYSYLCNSLSNQKVSMYTNKEIWNVSYPIFLGLLAQNIINVTDTAFLGRVGEVELGASAMGGLFYICVFTIAFGFVQVRRL